MRARWVYLFWFLQFVAMEMHFFSFLLSPSHTLLSKFVKHLPETLLNRRNPCYYFFPRIPYFFRR